MSKTIILKRGEFHTLQVDEKDLLQMLPDIKAGNRPAWKPYLGVLVKEGYLLEADRERLISG